MMRHIIISLFLSSSMVTISADNNIEYRKPLKPKTQEIIAAIRETISGALGIVASKDDRDRDEYGKQEFDNAVRELATGFADLILVGVHQQNQKNNAYRMQNEFDELVEELVDTIKAHIKDLSL